MNLINPYIIPGPYADAITGEIIVVVDVITHGFNVAAQRQQPLPEPEVVWRQLVVEGAPKHERFSMPLSEFFKHYQAKPNTL